MFGLIDHGKRFHPSQLFFLLILILGGCQIAKQPLPESQPDFPQQRPIRSGEQVKVGVLLPLSGKHAKLGLDLQRATTLAILETGAKRVSLLYQDTKGTVDGARKAAAELLDKGAHIVIGPVFAQATRAAHALLYPKGVPVLSFSSDFRIAGRGIFLLGFDPAEQVRQILQYAAAKGNGRTIVIVPHGSLGERTRRALQSIGSGGGSFKTFTYQKNQPEDLKVIAETLKEETFDSLLIPDGQDVGTIISSLVYYDVQLEDVRLLGTSQWDGQKLSSDPNFYGAWYPAPSAGDRLAFESRFEDLMGHKPHRLASLGYDAIAMVVTLISKETPFPFSVRALTQRTGFAGLEGLFRLTLGGTNQRGLGVYEIRPRGVRLKEPAPRSFAGA